MSDVEAQIREAYEFYLRDNDPSAGEIFAQQVGQILDSQPQEGTDEPVVVQNVHFTGNADVVLMQMRDHKQPQEDT